MTSTKRYEPCAFAPAVRGGGVAARRRGAALALWMVLAPPVGAAGTPGPAGSDTEPRLLSPGVAVERKLAADEVHLYRPDPVATSSADRPWLVTVEQLGVNVIVEVQSSPPVSGEASDDGVDSPLSRFGEESVVVPAGAPPWRIVVRSAADDLPGAGYRIRLTPLAVESPRDRLRLQAETALSQAGRLVHRDTPESRQEALELYRQAVAQWRELDEPRQVARSEHCFGALARRADRLQEAIEALSAVAARWQQLGETALQVTALNELGLARWQDGDLAAAASSFQLGLDLGLEHRRPVLEVLSRSNLCLVRHYQGDLDAARSCYEAALALAEKLGAVSVKASLLTNLGGVHYLLGEPAPARDYYRRSLELQQELGELAGEANVRNNLAALHVSTGEYQQALLDYEEALETFRKLDDRRSEARALNNLGHTYQLLGETARARSFYEQALPLRRSTGDRRGEAVTLNNLGTLLRLAGDPQGALHQHEAALALHREPGSPRDEAITRDLIGQDLLDLHRPAEALAELSSAIATLEKVGDRRQLATAHRHRAQALAEAGRGSGAAEDLKVAVSLYRDIGDRVGEALAEYDRARLDSAAGRLQEAIDGTRSAIELLEGVRAGVDTPDLRASFLALQRGSYELLVDLYVRQGHVGPALEAAEAASARTLLDAVHEAAAELPRRIDPRLADLRDDTEQRLRIKTDRRLELDPSREPEKVATLDGEIDSLLSDLDSVEARIRQADPRYAELTRPPLLPVDGIQRLLDADTLVLRYSLGSEGSYVWRVTRDEISVRRLPPRRELDELAREAHEAFRQSGRGGAETATGGPVTELARQVLGPVAEGLDRQRIVVVADGGLDYIPFAALPVPGTRAAAGELLLDRHEVVTAPSMSVLAVQRHALERRSRAPRALAIIADPVFDPADHRVAHPAATSGLTGGETSADLPHAGDGSEPPVERGQGFARLRFSRREAETLAALVPPDERFVALDFAASRETVLSGVLAPYRIVHFATHGILDSERPDLSALVLSRVDEEGRPHAGLLGLRDIYDLKLEADLVVLSGCRTALGQQVRGEGLVGLTRGFLYAGVPRVVASLWPVDDRATAELMGAFYRGLLESGLAPGEALTRARREVRSQPRTHDPYYWAAFILQGDWRSATAADAGKVPSMVATSQ